MERLFQEENPRIYGDSKSFDVNDLEKSASQETVSIDVWGD